MKRRGLRLRPHAKSSPSFAAGRHRALALRRRSGHRLPRDCRLPPKLTARASGCSPPHIYIPRAAVRRPCSQRASSRPDQCIPYLSSGRNSSCRWPDDCLRAPASDLPAVVGPTLGRAPSYGRAAAGVLPPARCGATGRWSDRHCYRGEHRAAYRATGHRTRSSSKGRTSKCEAPATTPDEVLSVLL